MKKSFVGVGITLLCLTGCSTNEIQPSTVANNSQSIEQYKTIATNLEAPWAINKLGDTFYITERTGHIVKVEQGEMTRQAVKLEKHFPLHLRQGCLALYWRRILYSQMKPTLIIRMKQRVSSIIEL